MADEPQFSSRPDHKRKFDDPDAFAAAPRRPTGFSAPVASPSPDGRGAGPPQSYDNVPPPVDGIELAKQRAREIAARLFSDAEAKRPRVDDGGGADGSVYKRFGSAASEHSQKPLSQLIHSQVGTTAQSGLPSQGYPGSSRQIEIPNGRVGVIIGKSGETIKYLQFQSGAKIQVTRDMDADPNSLTRMVELMGTSEQISRAEQLINDVLAEADSGVSGSISSRKFDSVQPGAEQFQMKVPNNKVGLVIGKGGETIKNMQARSGARIQVIPLHLPPGETWTERTVYIDGTKEQIETAKQLVNEVISENRVRNRTMTGGYPHQGYCPPLPQTSWGSPGAPHMQQPGYGYMQPGAYAGPPLVYNTSQPPYGCHPPPTSSGLASGWDQTTNEPNQQAVSGSVYSYHTQQQPLQQQPTGGSAAPADSTSFNFVQPPSIYNNQGAYLGSTVGQQQGYGQDMYSSGYQAPASQPSYSQPTSISLSGYDHQQGYGSTSSYGTMVNPTQDESVPAYGAEGGANQANPAQAAPPGLPSATQQGYTGQQLLATSASYPTQGSAPSGYSSQFPAQTGYVQPSPLIQSSYGQPPQVPKSPNQALYGQTVSTQAGYVQPAQVQPGYGQPPKSQSGYVQDSAHCPPPPPSDQGQQLSHAGMQQSQPDCSQQQQQPYGSAYSQPPVRGAYDSSVPAQTVPSGVTKASLS